MKTKTLILFNLCLVLACGSSVHSDEAASNAQEVSSNSLSTNQETDQNMDNHNIDFRLTQGSSSQMFRASSGQTMTFKGGDLIAAMVNIDSKLQEKFADKAPKVVCILRTGSQEVARHEFVSDYAGSYMLNIPLIPASTAYPSESWSAQFAHGLSKMEKGTHQLILTVTMQVGQTTENIGTGFLIYDNRNGNGNYAEQAKAIQEKLGKDETELYADFKADHGESNIDESKYSNLQEKQKVQVTIVNNCGTSVRPFQYGNSDWITLDGSGGSRKLTIEIDTKIFRSDNGSPVEIATITAGHEGTTIKLCK